MNKDHLNIQPADPVKSFGKINFKENTFKVLRPDRVNGLLSQSNGFMNLSGV